MTSPSAAATVPREPPDPAAHGVAAALAEPVNGDALVDIVEDLLAYI